MESLSWYRQHLNKSLINIEKLIADHAKDHKTKRLMEDLQHLGRIVAQIEIIDNAFFMAEELEDGAVIPAPDIPPTIERLFGGSYD